MNDKAFRSRHASICADSRSFCQTISDNVFTPYTQLHCLKTATSITNNTNVHDGHGLQLTAHLMSAMKAYSVKDTKTML